jgi:predicted RNA-binding Zn-ribbon protein involved in translation (DUF1610 family)
MAWDPAHGERRRSYCPECAKHRRTPSSVTFAPGLRTVSYKCPACGQEWLVYRHASQSDGSTDNHS